MNQYTKQKRLTGRRELRCNHTLSDANALESAVPRTVQTPQHRRCKLAFRSILVSNYEWISNLTHSKPIKISLKCMNETKKKRLQKVFTLHYWRFFFFWFKYLFFVILFYYDMFYRLVFGWGGLERQGGCGAGSGDQAPVTYVRRLYMNRRVHIQAVVVVKETFAKSALFEDPAPRWVNPSWLRTVFCFSSSCIQKKKKEKRKQDRKWSGGGRTSVSPHQVGQSAGGRCGRGFHPSHAVSARLPTPGFDSGPVRGGCGAAGAGEPDRHRRWWLLVIGVCGDSGRGRVSGGLGRVHHLGRLNPMASRQSRPFPTGWPGLQVPAPERTWRRLQPRWGAELSEFTDKTHFL